MEKIRKWTQQIQGISPPTTSEASDENATTNGSEHLASQAIADPRTSQTSTSTTPPLIVPTTLCDNLTLTIEGAAAAFLHTALHTALLTAVRHCGEALPRPKDCLSSPTTGQVHVIQLPVEQMTPLPGGANDVHKSARQERHDH